MYLFIYLEYCTEETLLQELLYLRPFLSLQVNQSHMLRWIWNGDLTAWTAHPKLHVQVWQHCRTLHVFSLYFSSQASYFSRVWEGVTFSLCCRWFQSFFPCSPLLKGAQNTLKIHFAVEALENSSVHFSNNFHVLLSTSEWILGEWTGQQ